MTVTPGLHSADVRGADHGFVMAILPAGTFGILPPAWRWYWVSFRRGGSADAFKPRDLLLAIYLAWAVSLVLSLVAFGFRIRLRPAARLKTVCSNLSRRPAQLRAGFR